MGGVSPIGRTEAWHVAAAVTALGVVTLACVRWLGLTSAAAVATTYLMVVLVVAATSHLTELSLGRLNQGCQVPLEICVPPVEECPAVELDGTRIRKAQSAPTPPPTRTPNPDGCVPPQPILTTFVLVAWAVLCAARSKPAASARGGKSRPRNPFRQHAAALSRHALRRLLSASFLDPLAWGVGEAKSASGRCHVSAIKPQSYARAVDSSRCA
jgi:hypothetical protein